MSPADRVHSTPPLVTSSPDGSSLCPLRVMQRAWALFRSRYGYKGKGGIPFKSIGRHCFTACLRAAWAEAKHTLALGAMPDDHRRQSLRWARWELTRAQHTDTFTHTANEIIREMTARIRELLGTAPAGFVEATA